MKTKTGIVSSSKMDKTVVVVVHSYKSHPKYKKKYRTSKKFYAHDPDNVCQTGDTVTIIEHRPLSKNKRWKVISVNDQDISQIKRKPAAKITPSEIIPPQAAPVETAEENAVSQ